MNLIYVAGKYLGKCDWETYNNIHHARVAARRLWDLGWAVICPHSNSAFFGGVGESDRGEDWRKWINGDLEILQRCDAIYMLEGWESSIGANIEIEAAKEHGLEIYFEEAPSPVDKYCTE